MKAVIYLRVSTAEQTESGLGLDAQLSACLRKTQEFNPREVLTFTDAGISGAKDLDKRPGLTQALESTKSGDILIVAKRDRLSRDLDIASSVEKMLQKKHVRFISAAGEGTGVVNEDVSALMQRRMFQVFAEIERQMIRDRTRQALAVKKSRCERVGTIPFGYKLADDGIHLQEQPTEQALIAYIRALRSEGLSFERIVARLNSEGYVTRKGTKWQYRLVYNVVQSAARSGA